LLDQYPNDVSYTIKHFPLTSHKFAFPGAMAVLAAGKQGKYWEFHSRLLERHNKVNEDTILQIARELDLDLERFEQDRQSPASRKLIQEDMANGRAVGVRGTPSVFLNGKRIENKDIAKLPELILRELNK
jgi:protein-disulfide isomerase